jgi:RND family efflux transporter MFP subunit
VRYLISVLMVCAAGLVSAQPPANVVIDEARIETVERMRRVTGELRAFQHSRLASRQEGLVLELLVRAGDEVQKGQIIAKLDSVLAELILASTQANVAALEATVAQFQAEVDRAELEFERYENLVAQASASSQELDDARLAFVSAKAKFQRAKADVVSEEAKLALDRQQIEDMTIHAPFDSKVVSTTTEVGEWLGQGDVIVELYSVDSIEAWVDVPESIVERIVDVRGPVMVQIPAITNEVSGNIRQIVPVVDQLSRLFPVRISVPNDRRVLQPGMSVTAMIPTGQKEEMLTISKDAILRDDVGEYVYMAVPNEEAESPFKEQAIPVRIAREFSAGDRVVIRIGSMPPGARLVVEGNERMFPTQKLIDVSDTAHINEKDNAERSEPEAIEQGS